MHVKTNDNRNALWMYLLRPSLLAATTLTIATRLGACGSDDGPAECEAPASTACTCDDGQAGTRTCGDDGTFGPCICNEVPDTTETPDATDVSISEDSTVTDVDDLPDLGEDVDDVTPPEDIVEIQDIVERPDAVTTGCDPACGPLEQCNRVTGRETPLCVARSVAVTGGYAIDATEVSRAQYEAWLAGNPSTDGQDAWCTWNTDFAQGCTPPAGYTDVQLPVFCVDWCDAFAYCKAIGKRLCGRIGGGRNDYADHADATKSQWFNACSSGGENLFAYGDSYNQDACPGVYPIGTQTSCQSSVEGYQGVYDLSGSVFEWQDACEWYAGRGDKCHFSAGYSDSAGSTMARCGFKAGGVTRDHASLSPLAPVGIRCCTE